MSRRLRVHMVGATDRGKLRSDNEDAIAWDETRGFAILADGMGGHNAGDVASQLAVKTIHDELAGVLGAHPLPVRRQRGMGRYATLVHRAILAANAAVHQSAAQTPAYTDMGTTIVTAVYHDRRIVVGHVGDSRVYRLRGGELTPLTVDHSLAQELIHAGTLEPADVPTSGYGHILTRALGVEPDVSVEVAEHRTEPGDRYLLCSDGLTDQVSDATLTELLSTETKPEQSVTQLVDAANDQGGVDNVSVIVISLEPD